MFCQGEGLHGKKEAAEGKAVISMTDHSETGRWGIPEVKHLQMGGAPATREQSLIINSSSDDDCSIC